MSLKEEEAVMEDAEEEQRRRLKLEEEALEIQSLRRIVSAYLNYPEAAEEDIRRYERSYRKLPPAHKALLSHYPLKFQRLRRCISANSHFIFSMLQAFEPPLDMSQDIDECEDPHPRPEYAQKDHLVSEGINSCSCSCEQAPLRITCSVSNQHGCVESGSDACRSSVPVDQHGCVEGGSDACRSSVPVHPDEVTVTSPQQQQLDPSFQLNVPLVDVDKVRCIIRNIVRDWAVEGQKERDQCYQPILDELNILFPNRNKDSPPACLVPGAGLGRLALEISTLGFISQGNEFSYYMMICSSFILNDCETAGEWTIHPWIHSNCNSLSDSDQLRPVSIPDIHPASAGITKGFSMCGGDFVEVYGGDLCQIGAWDAVVTCFFIDTAHNIVEFIEIISKILKDGGVWINFGPLLYHFSDMCGEDEMSIELSLEDVKRVALHYGFELEKEIKTIETTYSTNARSMMQNRYFAAFWTMRKKSAAVAQQVPDNGLRQQVPDSHNEM